MNKNFKKGDIVYKIVSTNDGGLMILRREVANIGYIEDEVLTIDKNTGEDVVKTVKREIIKTTGMKKNEFETSEDYYKREDLKDNLFKYLDNVNYI